MSFELLLSFSLATFLICLAPGPDNIFVLMLSALYGKKSGMCVTLGLCSGLGVHSLIVALGVASLLQALPYAFVVISYIGALYLAYLAWLSFKASNNDLMTDNVKLGDNNAGQNSSFDTEALSLYLRGFYMNITNPKVTIFFIAFLPQFTSPEQGNMLMQCLVLGLVFIFIALLVFSFIAAMAGRLGNLLNRSSLTQRYLNRVVSLVFIILSLNLILYGSGF